MIKVFLVIFQSIVYWTNLMVISKKVLNYKTHSKSLAVFASFVYVFLFVIGLKCEHSIFICTNIIIQIIQILSARLFIKNMRISSVVGIYLLLSSINMILVMVATCIIGVFDGSLLWVDFTVNLITFTGCFICCSNSKVCIRIQQVQLTLPKGIKILTITSFTISAWIMSMILVNPAFSQNASWSIAMRLSLVLLALFVCTTVPVLLITVLTNSHLKKQNEIFERELEAQANHYSALAKSNYELRRFRHDFSNIRIGITKSLNENDPQTALEMLTFGQNSLYQATDEIVPFDTGNGIVDAILSDKQSKAKVHNIAIHFSGSVPPTALSPIDLCVIFGNTVDNAIEACQKLPTDMEKTISISSICCNGYIFITIENPVAQTVTITNNFVSTTKENSNLHGFGLYSLNKTIKKYDGDLKLTSENNTFRVNMDMCLKLSSTN